MTRSLESSILVRAVRQGEVKPPRIPPTPSHAVVCATHTLIKPQSISEAWLISSFLAFGLEKIGHMRPSNGTLLQTIVIFLLDSKVARSSSWVRTFFFVCRSVWCRLLRPGWTQQYITQTCDEGSYRKLQGGKSYPGLNKNSKLARNLLSLRVCFLCNRASQKQEDKKGFSCPQPSQWREGVDGLTKNRFPTLCHDQHIISSSLQLERWADNLAGITQLSRFKH